MSVPLNTHKQIRNAGTILLIGGEPEEEQTLRRETDPAGRQERWGELIVVNDTPIRMTEQAKQLSILPGFLRRLCVAFAGSADSTLAENGYRAFGIRRLTRHWGETEGELVILVGGNLSTEAQALIAKSAANFVRYARVLLHRSRLIQFSRSNDMSPGKKPLADVLAQLQSAAYRREPPRPKHAGRKGIVVVQELFETETTAVCGCYIAGRLFRRGRRYITNNTGFVQVYASHRHLHQSKPDWTITTLIAAKWVSISDMIFRPRAFSGR